MKWFIRVVCPLGRNTVTSEWHSEPDEFIGDILRTIELCYPDALSVHIHPSVWHAERA